MKNYSPNWLDVQRVRSAAQPDWQAGISPTAEYRAVHDELAIAKFRAPPAGDNSILDIGENLKLLPKLTAISFGHGVRRPLIEIAVPKRAIVGRNGRNAAKHVVGAIAKILGNVGRIQESERVRARAIQTSRLVIAALSDEPVLRDSLMARVSEQLGAVGWAVALDRPAT